MNEQDEIARLRSIMAAAADEIEEHWDAHCDAEGFGPVNLVRRLRTGKGDYRKKPSKIEFLWFQCSQCGWGQRINKAEAKVDGWEE